MPIPAPNLPWNSLTRQLPFPLDDTTAVNHYFLRWHHSRRLSDKRAIDIWAYCYINQYFRAKLRRARPSVRTTQDQMIERAYLKVQQNLENVHQPQRFSHWVSVICKHTFINHTRKQPTPVPLRKRHTRSLPVATRYSGRFYDAEITYDVLTAAINRLPSYLQRTARLRFLRYLSYLRISEITGRPVPTVRTYIHKATRRLQKDPALRLLRKEILES